MQRYDLDQMQPWVNGISYWAGAGAYLKSNACQRCHALIKRHQLNMTEQSSGCAPVIVISNGNTTREEEPEGVPDSASASNLRILWDLHRSVRRSAVMDPSRTKNPNKGTQSVP